MIMTKTRGITLWARIAGKRWKKPVIVLAVIGALLIVGWGIPEISYQQHVGSIRSEVQKVTQDVVKPAGGVSFRSTILAPHWLDQFGCFDVGPCPKVGDVWFVPIAPSKEADFMNTILQHEGYDGTNQSGIVYAHKDNFEMRLEMTAIGNNQPPQSAPAGKEWRFIDISVYDKK